MIKTNGLKLVKNYNIYIKESLNEPRIINIRDIIDKNKSIASTEDEIDKLLKGEICIWYTKGHGELKKQVISEVRLTRPIQGEINVYLNGFSVNIDYGIEIEERLEDEPIKQKEFELVGLPSGEVLYLTKSEMKLLHDFNLIRYEKWMRWRDMEFKDFYFFKDQNYHKIRGMLDHEYIQPRKSHPILNVKEKNNYEIGDIIVCKGFSEKAINLTDRVGKIVNMDLDKDHKGFKYLVSFLMKFSMHLMKNNTLWINEKNIKGIYTGDIQLQIQLAKMQKEQEGGFKSISNLEEHELDDDYHIRQAFKKKID